MGYRLSLVRRWTRRDRLAIIVIAVTVAFFTGATLITGAAATQTTQIAAEYSPGGYVVEDTGPTALPVSELADGGTYIGFPADTAALPNVSEGWPPSGQVSQAHVATVQQRTLHGPSGEFLAQVHPRPHQTVIPGHWYAGPQRMTESLGSTTQLTVRPTDDVTGAQGTPLKSALAFFVQGTRSLLALLGTVTLGAAILVGVTVYAVVRMTVRDRRDTITVLRATGARRRNVMAAFALRAGLLSLVGVLLGYAVGVILPNAAVNVAVFSGLDVSLTARVTTQTLRALLPGYALILLGGVLAGILAARPALTRPPLDQPTKAAQESRVSLPAVVQPDLLGWRALVPTASALTVFVVLTVLLVALGSTLGPVFAATGATVTEPGASHPVASTVPSSHADALQASGLSASPEILLFSVVDGTPFLSRGVDFASFTNVTDAQLVAGERPQNRRDAVIGTDLAETLDVDVGETVLLGGSTTAAFTRVTITGKFSGHGVTDDQLLVSLPTARHLSSKPTGTVQFIRTHRQPSRPDTSTEVRVLSVSQPTAVPVNQTVTLTARVVNLGDRKQSVRLPIHIGRQPPAESQVVTLDAFETRRLEIPITVQTVGRHHVRIGNTTTTLHVQPASALTVSELPARAPPNATLSFRVRTIGGTPVPNATVSFGESQTTTNTTGRATISVPEPGNRTLRITKGNASITRSMLVAQNAERTALASMRFHPQNPSFLTEPTLKVTLTNPWNTSLRPALTARGLNEPRSWTTRLPSGSTAFTRLQLPRQSPGTRDVTLLANDTVLAKQSLDIAGDDRLVAAVATRGSTTQGSSLGRAITTIFGNIQVLLGTFVGLGIIVTIGSVTAAFGAAIWARRRTIAIQRAVGVPARALLTRILTDALRVGSVALILSLTAGYTVAYALTQTGYTTIYGVRITPSLDLTTIGALTAGGLTVVLLGAAAAAVPLLRAPPHEFLGGGSE